MCHAFIVAPTTQRLYNPLLRRGKPAPPPSLLTSPPTGRRIEAAVRLYQAKKSKTEATRHRRNNNADPIRDDAVPSSDEDRRRQGQQQQQQHEEFVELGRQSFAQYFAYDLDDWQLEAGGAIASGHNVIVCGTYIQIKRDSYDKLACCYISLGPLFLLSLNYIQPPRGAGRRWWEKWGCCTPSFN